MKRILAVAALLVVTSIGAFASPMMCANISSVAFTNGSLLNDTVDICTLASGQAFTVFSAFAQSGFPGNGSAFSLMVSVNGNQLIFDTSSLAGEHVTIYFRTSPGIPFVTLGTGSADSVSENICAGKPDEASGAEVCPGGASFLNTTSPISASNGGSASSGVTSSAVEWFIKNDSGGIQFTQTFTAVPEPVTFPLIGAGLLGLGILSRRVRK